MPNHQPPQLFHGIEQFLAHLLDQYSPEQSAQRAHIPPQGMILGGIVRLRRKLGQTGLLIVRLPQWFGSGHEVTARVIRKDKSKGSSQFSVKPNFRSPGTKNRNPIEEEH